MSALTSPRAYEALGGYMVVSSVADAIPLAFVAKVLDDIGFPEQYRWIFSPIKAAAAVGLFSVRWSPGLARLTTAMLTIYFILAVAFHLKARDLSLAAAGAATFAVLFGAMTAKGPDWLTTPRRPSHTETAVVSGSSVSVCPR